MLALECAARGCEETGMWYVWIDEPGGELPSAVSRLIPPPPAPPERCFPTVPVLSCGCGCRWVCAVSVCRLDVVV
jgi:hypothetical protein